MNVEDKNIEYKSLKKAVGDKSNHRDLAETCVCFGKCTRWQNNDWRGGPTKNEPPINQKIKQEDVNKLIKSLRGLTDGVGIVNPEISNARKWWSILYIEYLTFHESNCNHFIWKSINACVR